MSRSPGRWFARAGAWSLALLGVGSFVGACSLLNQEGPDVSCQNLDCGRINACQDGIIAQCADGLTVKYRVCGASDLCKEAWQITGQFRCSEEATDCEGCRPERTGCGDPTLTTSSSTTGSTGAASSTSGGEGGSGGSGSTTSGSTTSASTTTASTSVGGAS